MRRPAKLPLQRTPSSPPLLLPSVFSLPISVYILHISYSLHRNLERHSSYFCFQGGANEHGRLPMSIYVFGDAGCSEMSSLGIGQVSRDHDGFEVGADASLSFPSNWAIHISDIKTLKIGNISLSASEQDIREFFSFSGEIVYIEMKSESEASQLAYVTFKESQGANTAILLAGAKIVDRSVTITPVEDYKLPADTFSQEKTCQAATESAVVKKAEDMVSSMLAKGFILGKDAASKAKSFDERHQLTTKASATVASFDQKMGISEKLSIGSAAVNDKVREVDGKYQVSEKTRSAFATAEQKASLAGSALMNNRYVSTGASWVSSALNMVAKAAEDVTTMTKEKLEKAEEIKKEDLGRARTGMVNEFAKIHLDNEPVVESSKEPPVVPVNSMDDNKLNTI